MQRSKKGRPVETLERAKVEALLKTCRYSLGEAAYIAGLSRPTFTRIAKSYGLVKSGARFSRRRPSKEALLTVINLPVDEAAARLKISRPTYLKYVRLEGLESERLKRPQVSASVRSSVHKCTNKHQ